MYVYCVCPIHRVHVLCASHYQSITAVSHTGAVCVLLQGYQGVHGINGQLFQLPITTHLATFFVKLKRLALHTLHVRFLISH